MPRRGQLGLLLVVVSGLFSVLLAIAVNVATGGRLPAPVAPYAWLAWPVVGLLAVTGIGLALWQQRLNEEPATRAVDPHPSEVEFRYPAELPTAVALFGRAGDLTEVDRAVNGGARVIVLAAAPGTGKTALAIRVAHDLRARYPHGQLYAALRGASPDPVRPDVVLARFLDALGYADDERRGTVDDLAARFRSAVADRRVLVVLDDARDLDQVRPLLPGGSRCLTLITSRRVLAELPGAVTVPVRGLGPAAALALLAEAAGEDRIAADPAGSHRIVAACGGLPLAIRVIGGRLRARSQWTPTALADRLHDEERRLDELHLGDRAVRSTFRSAYDALAPADRMVFRRTGAAPGQLISLGAAAARCGLDESTTRDSLDRLVDAFLVETPAPDRYQLHDLLRLFATETFHQEETPADRARCLIRHADWVIATARTGAWLAEERESLAAVVAAVLAAPAPERVGALVDTLSPLLTAFDDHDLRLRLWTSAQAAAVALDDRARLARARRWVSHSYWMGGQTEEELAPAEQALALAEELDDPQELAQAQFRVGEALRSQLRFPEAEAALNRALTLFLELGNVTEELEVRAGLGALYNTMSRYDASIPILERAVELLPPAETSTHGWVLLALALAYRSTGRDDAARALIGQAFGVATRIDDQFLLGYCHADRASVATDDGRTADAERDLREMLAIFERIRHGAGIGSAHRRLGLIAEEQGHGEEALTEFAAAIAQYDRLGDRTHVVELRLDRARILRALGREADAVRETTAADELGPDPTVTARWSGVRDRSAG